MKKLLAIVICSIPFAVVPTVFAQSGSSGSSSTGAPSTAPTPDKSMGGTSASSGKHGTAGATMGEGMKSDDKSKAADGVPDSTEASKKIGGEPVDIGTKKDATAPGTSANGDKSGKNGTGSK